jgi:hypothetical protein
MRLAAIAAQSSKFMAGAITAGEATTTDGDEVTTMDGTITTIIIVGGKQNLAAR